MQFCMEIVCFQILVLLTKKIYSSFLQKSFVFLKICFKVKVLKTFKIFSDRHMKIYRSLRRRAILKILAHVGIPLEDSRH